MIKFKSPHFLRVLDVASKGSHSLLIITSDIFFMKKIIYKEPSVLTDVYLDKPCPCGNFKSTNRLCTCTPEEIKKHQANFAETDMTFVITDFPFEYLEFDKSNIEREGLHFLETAYRTKGMLPSELEATLRVAKTISEMDKSNNIKAMHIAEALQYALEKVLLLGG